MAELSPEQLNSLDRETLIIIISSLKAQLDSANSMLADNNRQIELLMEQIRIMNQRHFGKKSESSSSMIEGQTLRELKSMIMFRKKLALVYTLMGIVWNPLSKTDNWYG